MIKVSICLSDLPKDKITESTSNSKKYISIVVDERREPDKYGNTHSIYVNQTEEERKRKEKKVYVGNGKEYVFDNNQTQPQTQAVPTLNNDADDLPF